MVIKAFGVVLDNASGQYLPGSPITGQIVVQVEGEETAMGITIRLFGEAEAGWQESRRVGRPYHTTDVNGHSVTRYHYHTVYDDFKSSQSLFNMTVLAFGDGQNKQRIPNNGMKIPFTFQLPNIPLPVSCTLEKGFVKYGVEARMRHPWYTTDVTSTTPFMVLPLPLDLNIIPSARIPSVTTESMRFGSCCCESEPLTVSARTPVMGWCMGDQVPVIVEIFNKSDKRVTDVVATFLQIWIMYATCGQTRHSKNHEILGTSIRRREGVEVGATGVWQFTMEIPLNIPPTPFTQTCEIVKIEYWIKLELMTEGDSLIAKLPLIIGNTKLAPALVTEHSPLYEGVGSSG